MEQKPDFVILKPDLVRFSSGEMFCLSQGSTVRVDPDLLKIFGPSPVLGASPIGFAPVGFGPWIPVGNVRILTSPSKTQMWITFRLVE